jgi:hypothetical protein
MGTLTSFRNNLLGNAILPTDIVALLPRHFHFPQNPDDLPFRKPWFGHLGTPSLHLPRCLEAVS